MVAITITDHQIMTLNLYIYIYCFLATTEFSPILLAVGDTTATATATTTVHQTVVVFVFVIVVSGPTAVHDQRSVLPSKPRAQRRGRLVYVQNIQHASTTTVHRCFPDDGRRHVHRPNIPTVLPTFLPLTSNFGKSRCNRSTYLLNIYIQKNKCII